jgi:transposase
MHLSHLTVLLLSCQTHFAQSFSFTMSYKLDLRKQVANLFGRLKTSEILNVFKDKPISRATIFRVLKDCRDGKEPENKKIPGRSPKLSARTTKSLLSSAKNKVGQSTRKLARKFGISKSGVHKILAKNNVIYRKRQRAPKYTAKQLEKIPICCRALRRKHFANGKCIILDDEKYFTFAHHELSGNDGYYTDNIETTPDDVKYAGKSKFEPKVLVWASISSKGVSAPLIRPNKSKAVNADIYIGQCLPKLKQFIEKYHAGDEIMFWPDLASSHYAKKTLDWLNERKIPFVPKEDNPPNLPQARPIEKFWAVLDRMVYDGGWEAQNEQQLINRIKRKMKEIDINTVQNLIRDIRSTLRKIEDNGPLSAL